MKLSAKNSFLLGYVFVMCIFWAGLQASGIKNLTINLIWGIGINFIPLFGGVFGLFTARRWGLRGAVGKGVFYLSSGLLSWSAGNWIWSYYNFFHNVNVPYPSLADIGYITAVPLWMAGIFFLSKATGAKIGLRKIGGSLYIIFLPIIAAIFSYYFLYVIARNSSFDWSDSSMLKIFFDIAYPVGDWIILTQAFLIWGLSLKYLGGRYRWPVFITLFGFVAMFFADFSFSYMTTLNTYYNGSISDLFFVAALFIISFGIVSIDT